MAIVESESNLKKNEAGEENEDEIMYNVFPDMRRIVDYENQKITFEVSLPGVKKEGIKLKVLPEWFHLEGRRGKMMYSANQNFGKKVVPEKTTAKYENGLLEITAYIPNPLENAKTLEL